jgi:hypothetical protein
METGRNSFRPEWMIMCPSLCASRNWRKCCRNAVEFPKENTSILGAVLVPTFLTPVFSSTMPYLGLWGMLDIFWIGDIKNSQHSSLVRVAAQFDRGCTCLLFPVDRPAE